MTGTVTALKFQRRNRQRVSVYLDGAYAFGLPDTVAAQLRIGQTLTDGELAELKEQDNLERAYQRTLVLLSHRARSVMEIHRYLERLEVTQEAIAIIVERLTGYGYLDDLKFAQAWVSDRERFRPRSPAALRNELREKGISQEIIAQVLSEIDQDASAQHAAEAYARRLQHLDERSFRQKLGNHLLRRGFAHSVVWKVVDQMWQQQQDDNPQEEFNSWQ
ncbi:MAG: RecX family transcriptional regulator [Anaerolineae bacterium]|nr:RecX family transcriptional regulator [Anaerolineae bacterium]MCB9130967.1 RecX family transcriptional regulator [Anaerolineales bacterium]MCB0231290.1 RecX family transcriptional regulator [Anaerolineae bacterium]MCB0235454.1 RecX family transcriptional regulator [Anaerolineae bacterium]MCB0241078.1 RecX family transcriptional regulator [Anaerolineae bacterium]